MTFDQIAALTVLVCVVAAMVDGRMRADIIALVGAAVLLVLGVVRPVEVQGAFASPAVIALAGLFVIAYAIELSGLLGLVIRKAKGLTKRFGRQGIWMVIGVCGTGGAFLNNTPVVVLAAPIVRDMAKSMGLSPKRFLMPLSYIVIMGGLLTLVGTSTNLLVNDMASNAGQPVFGMFEMFPAGVAIMIVGAVYLYFIGARQLNATARVEEAEMAAAEAERAARRQAAARSAPQAKRRLLPFSLPRLGENRTHTDGSGDGVLGDVALYEEDAERPFDLKRALISLGVFVLAIAAAASGLAPIAATAFAGAVALVLLRVVTAEEAYAGLRPEILLLIAGMVVIGQALEVTGLASAGAQQLISLTEAVGPFGALIILYGVTLFATDLLSNATVAVLMTPIAVALAEALGVDARPFLIGVMMAASAAFSTPFGYQTNVLVYQMGGYAYLDFVKVGMALNFITWITAMIVIPIFYPF